MLCGHWPTGDVSLFHICDLGDLDLRLYYSIRSSSSAHDSAKKKSYKFRPRERPKVRRYCYWDARACHTIARVARRPMRPHGRSRTHGVRSLTSLSGGTHRPSAIARTSPQCPNLQLPPSSVQFRNQFGNYPPPSPQPCPRPSTRRQACEPPGLPSPFLADGTAWRPL